MTILCALITAYIVVVFIRIVLSWFPMRHDSPVATINRLVTDLTEPVLAPLRRVIPPAGIFDLSTMVLVFVLIILRGVVCAG